MALHLVVVVVVVVGALLLMLLSLVATEDAGLLPACLPACLHIPPAHPHALVRTRPSNCRRQALSCGRSGGAGGGLTTARRFPLR